MSDRNGDPRGDVLARRLGGAVSGAQTLIHRNISPNPALARVPGVLAMPKRAWNEGLKAGELGHAKCPYSAASRDGWAWSSGYIEGRANATKFT